MAPVQAQLNPGHTLNPTPQRSNTLEARPELLAVLFGAAPSLHFPIANVLLPGRIPIRYGPNFQARIRRQDTQTL